jgi:hypothetical protein
LAAPGQVGPLDPQVLVLVQVLVHVQAQAQAQVNTPADSRPSNVILSRQVWPIGLRRARRATPHPAATAMVRA